jgi:hypothetical protein
MVMDVAEVEVEVEEAEAEVVGNDGKQVVTAENRRQQQKLDGDSGDSLGWMASGEVSVVL